MSAALSAPFVTESDGWKIALFDGYAILWVNEQVCDVDQAIEACLTPSMRTNWTVTAVRSDDIWEIYRLDRIAPAKFG